MRATPREGRSPSRTEQADTAERQSLTRVWAGSSAGEVGDGRGGGEEELREEMRRQAASKTERNAHWGAWVRKRFVFSRERAVMISFLAVPKARVV